MPRRYWHSDKKKSWNKSGDSEDRPRPPPGLRGREIGLFYRDLQKNKPKREFSMNLSIPSRVLNHVGELLEKIEITAKAQDIDIKNILTLPNWDLLSTEQNTNQGEPSTSGFSKTPALKEDASTVKQENIANISPYPKANLFAKIVGADFLDSSASMPAVERALAPKKPITEDLSSEDFVPIKGPSNLSAEPSNSEGSNYIPMESHYAFNYGPTEKLLSFRPSSKDYKYSYYDIITESFDEKLEASLSQGIKIDTKNSDTLSLNESLYLDYCDMLKESKYKKMLEFRKKLPTYNKTKDILDMVNNNQVILISGETGCGKSTQVPQILLDNALRNKEGGNINIMVTEPRRIAASSLAERVAEERAEHVGRSVGYAVRLEKINPRPKGSIVYCTTGILLNDLEVDQALTNFSHIVLDEVHERDTHIDLAMCILKKIMLKRKDLKLILMSATLDAARLSAYFDDCPILHIEGLAYPVKDVYMEEILKLTSFRLEAEETASQSSFQNHHNKRGKGHRPQFNRFQSKQMEKEIQYRASTGPWLESIKDDLDRDVYKTLLNHKIEEINYDLIVQLLVHINYQKQGAVLIFLPGINEITKLMTAIKDHGMFNSSRYEIYPLHSKLPSLEQRKIFERPPEGVRKIIIATNIAETSITIDDIVYVIDCGKMKLKGLNVQDNVQTLNVEWISQANLRQRRGRAGRCQPGICYHLLTSYRASKLDERVLPELQRSNLLEPVLSVKQLRLDKAEEALQMVPDPPALSTIQWAVKHLQQCGALDDKEVLTPLGWHLARLPVHPAAGKLLLFGALFGCLDRAASVAAVWGFKDPFLLIIGNDKEKAQDLKRELAMGEPSDHIAMAEAIIRWESLGHERRSFAYRYFLSNHTLELLSEMKNQFGDNLKQMGFLTSNSVRGGWVNRNRNNLSLFKAVVAASLYPNIATVKWSNLNHRNPNKPPRISARTPEEGRVDLHPSSVMSSMRGGKGSKPLCANPGANWLAYWIKQKSTQLFLIDVTLVYTLPLLFFGEFKVSNVVDEPEYCHISISSIKVRCRKDTAALLLQLRSLLDYVLANKVMATSDDVTKHNEFEEQVLNAVIAIISAEDEQAEYVGDHDDDRSESDQSDVEHKQRKWKY